MWRHVVANIGVIVLSAVSALLHVAEWVTAVAFVAYLVIVLPWAFRARSTQTRSRP